MPEKYVCYSTNEVAMYAWFVPLTALMWREVAGYRSIVAAVGDVPSLVLDAAAEVGARVVPVAPVKCCGGGTLSQIVRLFAYLAPGVEPEDYVLLGDADAWPLQEFAFRPATEDLFLMYADWVTSYPIGYIGARARVWRDIVRIHAPTMGEAVEELFLTDPVLADGRSDGWNYDEACITAMIKAWRGFPGRTQLVPRSGDPIAGRIDRAAWPADPRVDGMIDAHLLRPGWTDENWPRLRPLLAQLLPPGWLAWADAYRDGWVKDHP